MSGYAKAVISSLSGKRSRAGGSRSSTRSSPSEPLQRNSMQFNESNGSTDRQQYGRTSSSQGSSKRYTGRSPQLIIASSSGAQNPQPEVFKPSFAQVQAPSVPTSSSSKYDTGLYGLHDLGYSTTIPSYILNSRDPESPPAPQKPAQTNTQTKFQERINARNEEHVAYLGSQQGGRDAKRQATESNYRSNSVEIARMREELQRRDGESVESERNFQAAKDAWQVEVDNYKETVQGLEEVLESSHEAYKQLEHQFKEMETELSRTKRQWELDVNQHSQAARTAHQKAEDLQRQLNAMQGHLNQNKKLLNERADELKIVENYVSKANGISGKEVTDIVEALNQEISQTSSTIIDSLDFKDGSRRRLTNEERAHILPQLEMNLPHLFLSRLARHRPISDDVEEDLGVQMALQALMAEDACFYAQSWCPSNGDLARCLQDIHEGLRKSDPLMAPRWRSMTHSQVRQRTAAQDIQTIDTTLRSHLSLLLNACGWSDDYISSNERHSEAIGRGLEIITEKIMQLNKAIFEDLLQDEVKLLWFKSGSAFNPDLATDEFSGVQKIYGRILCTTDLGVQIITPKSGGDVVATTLKTKIVLDDVLYKNYQNAGEGKRENRKY